METLSALLAICAGKSPVTGEFPAQRSVTLSLCCFFFICASTNGWANNRDAGDLRRHRAHYDFIVIEAVKFLQPPIPMMESDSHVCISKRVEVSSLWLQWSWRSWWRHQMETFSALLAIFAGNLPVTSRPLWRHCNDICLYDKTKLWRARTDALFLGQILSCAYCQNDEIQALLSLLQWIFIRNWHTIIRVTGEEVLITIYPLTAKKYHFEFKVPWESTELCNIKPFLIWQLKIVHVISMNGHKNSGIGTCWPKRCQRFGGLCNYMKHIKIWFWFRD